MVIPHLDAAAVLARLAGARRPYQDAYLAFYSSWFGGLVTDPALMLVPIDDHMVHRGDAVFESAACVDGALYNLEAHWARLEHSATAIHLQPPADRAALTGIVAAAVRAGGQPDCGIRIFLSRGPGSFTVNPFDCPHPHLYVVVTRREPGPMERHPEGLTLRTSALPPKPAFYAAIKSCNYLPNALMKREAVLAGAHYPVGFDERGFLAEGAAETLGVVTADRRLVFPRPGPVLSGTTMQRVLDLAARLVDAGLLVRAGTGDVPRAEVDQAAEVLVCSTSYGVASAVRLDGRPVGAGAPGPVAARLHTLLMEDMRRNAALRTPVFEPHRHGT